MVLHDMLRVEIERAIRATQGSDAEVILERVETAIRNDHAFPRRVVAKALRAAFPDRAPVLLAQLDSALPQKARVTRERRPRARREPVLPYGVSSLGGQDVPWSTD